MNLDRIGAYWFGQMRALLWGPSLGVREGRGGANVDEKIACNRTRTRPRVKNVVSSLSVARVHDSALLGTPMPLLRTHPLATYGGYDQDWPPASLYY